MTEPVSRLNTALSDANFNLSCEIVRSQMTRPTVPTIDQILQYDAHERAEIVLLDGTKFAWYFAIGSMMNPVSLFLRAITPWMSYPAKCLHHKLVFRAPNGMADIEPSADAELHGVVHLIADEQMRSLDAVELMYHRLVINSVNYQGQSHLVHIYKMSGDNHESLPSERYLDIIVKGCEYYKVESKYIDKLRREQQVVPRKLPHSFQSFKDIPENVFYSVEELKTHDGNNPSLPLWISINGKILEYTGLPPDDHPDFDFQKRMYLFVQSRLGGRDVALETARALYDPMYKLPLTKEDLCAQHRAQIEDHLYDNINGPSRNYWRSVGRLREIS